MKSALSRAFLFVYSIQSIEALAAGRIGMKTATRLTVANARRAIAASNRGWE
jgi:Na+/H+-translocating membrane pyrophosphatase